MNFSFELAAYTIAKFARYGIQRAINLASYGGTILSNLVQFTMKTKGGCRSVG